jgi:hypothetical protein
MRGSGKRLESQFLACDHIILVPKRTFANSNGMQIAFLLEKMHLQDLHEPYRASNWNADLAL